MCKHFVSQMFDISSHVLKIKKKNIQMHLHEYSNLSLEKLFVECSYFCSISLMNFYVAVLLYI